MSSRPREGLWRKLPLSVYLPLGLVATLGCIAGLEASVQWLRGTRLADSTNVRPQGDTGRSDSSVANRHHDDATSQNSSVGNPSPTQPAPARTADPTSVNEQLFIYQLNKLRSNPQKFKVEYGIDCDLSDVEPRPPLAVNTLLATSAQLKAREMAKNDYVAHHSEVTGKWPNALARDAGFQLPDYFPVETNNIESIAAGYEDATAALRGLILDKDTPSLGHRIHLLGMDAFNKQATQVGVGYDQNAQSLYHHYWAIHATWTPNDRPFLTGVVYADRNQNHAYDAREGAPGAVLIVDSNTRVVCNEAGGWSLAVSPGKHVVELSSPEPEQRHQFAVEVGEHNIAVDLLTCGTIQIGFASPP